MTAPEPPILIVDDDQTILNTVREILHLEGYPVTTASNGAEALKVIEREHPSLVLLDMRMPVLDGWGFAKKVRERGLDVPILVMTAAQDARVWADEIGAEGYLAKPFDLMELLDSVARLRVTSHPAHQAQHQPAQHPTSGQPAYLRAS
jgi:two-component system, chemotaxis family, chemotaxis protein CheY